MNRNEIRKHLAELSNSEKKYLNDPSVTLNDFYLTLEKMGMKDENGIFIMPEKLIDEGAAGIRNIDPSFFWNRLDTSIHQNEFILKKATRFYREPFMSADFIAIRYVYAGECIIYTPGNKIIMKQNDVMLMNCGFIVSQHLKHAEDIVFTFLFKRKYISERLQSNSLVSNEITRFFFDYINRKDSIQSYQLYHGGDNLLIKDAIEAILCEFLDPIKDGGNILLESLLNVFLIQLSTCPYESELKYKDDVDRIAGMLNYINLNYQNVTLEILSLKYGYNAKYISRFFKKLTGVSFKDYVFKKKLHSFINGLVNTNQPIQKLLEKENISSETYFFNRFKKIYHMSPAEYRNKMQK